MLLSSKLHFGGEQALLPGSDDGKWIFESIFAALKSKAVAQAA